MSIVFTGVRVFPYRGTAARFPVKLPQGVRVPPNRVPPSVVPISILWNVYWQLGSQATIIGVEINLQAASVQAQILDRIASVKIDNIGSSAPIYVLFPDTGDVIACQPNSSVTFPCLTNLLSAIVYATGLIPGFIPVTRVYFYNVDLPPSVDPEIGQALSLHKASPIITRGTTIFNQNYGVPALGDQFHSSGGLSLTGPNSVGLWNTPYASGFLYITHLVVNSYGMIPTGAPPGAAFLCDIILESTGISGTLIDINFNSSANGTTSAGVVALLDITGQIKLDATQTWQMRLVAPAPNGFAQAISTFTQGPI